MVETKHSLVLCLLGLVLGLQTSLAMTNAQRLERALVPPAGGQVPYLDEASGGKAPRFEKGLVPPAGGEVRNLNGAEAQDRNPSGGPQSATIQTADLNAEVNTFLAKELAAHLADIKTLDPPPDRVVGALTGGEFSWGPFMRAVAVYAETSGQRELAGRDLAKWVGKIGLIEAKGGG